MVTPTGTRPPLSESMQRLARLLASLRREARQQSGLDAQLLPPDVDTAYRVAGRVQQLLGWPVAGWKIAATNQDMQRALRTSAPIYGRVLGDRIITSPYTVEHAPLCSPIPEVEFQVRLAKDLPVRGKLYEQDEVADAVGSVHPGIELAECRFIHDERFPPLPAILADGSGSGTLVVGPAIDNWATADIANQAVRLFCNGQLRRSGNAAQAMQHPLVPVTWLANELSHTGVGLQAGQLISTGTMTGMLKPAAGDEFLADFGPLGEVRLTLT